MNLVELQTFAEKRDIPVEYIDLKSNPALCVRLNKRKCAVALNKRVCDNGMREKVRLAHELGHCETGTLYQTITRFETRSRYEYRADAWAIKKLVPLNELKKALKKGIIEPWELAEYFDVTYEFMDKTINYYKNKGL